MAAEGAKNFPLKLIGTPCDHVAGRTFKTCELQTMGSIPRLRAMFWAVHGCTQVTVKEANPKLPFREAAVRPSSQELNHN